jgi:2-oxo-4-hydroxy-4-carboxy-5-ureidoimidazoline decarboxylase
VVNADLELDGLSALSPVAFAEAIGPLFESAPRFLARLAGAGPFADWPALFAAARSIALAMPEPEQVELIDAHPRLGADPRSVSALSFREQGYNATARADAAAEARRVAPELERLNDAYEARFGFRYCVFVAGRSRAELLPEMRSALERDRASELHRALEAVVDIAQARRIALQGGAR